MTVIGEPRHFHHKYRFIVEIDGFGSSAFQACSELSAELAEIKYYEGGRISPIKEPAKVDFADLTLDRGATKDADMYNWFLSTANAALQGGLRSPLYKRNGNIVQLDRDGATLRRWQLNGLWPKKFVGGAWDNTADEFTMEQLVVSMDYFQLRRNV